MEEAKERTNDWTDTFFWGVFRVSKPMGGVGFGAYKRQMVYIRRVLRPRYCNNVECVSQSPDSDVYFRDTRV